MDKTVKVIFEKPFDFHPDGEWRTIISYQPNEEPQTVTRECAKKAIKAKCAVAYKEAKDESGKAKKKA